ncbi:MAG: hypothetical protein NTY14_01855 [Candidatus Omnitrophica bacterium]|nr:hypothetical protein [Candidatus Omnitrophota bacterium]
MQGHDPAAVVQFHNQGPEPEGVEGVPMAHKLVAGAEVNNWPLLEPQIAEGMAAELAIQGQE